MPKSNLTWYKSKSKRIMKMVSSLQRKTIAEEIGITSQAVGKNINNGSYERELSKWIIILNLAGYEIKEKEGEY